MTSLKTTYYIATKKDIDNMKKGVEKILFFHSLTVRVTEHDEQKHIAR